MDIKLLTYNLGMLPGPFGSKKERVEEFVEIVLKGAPYDILCFQEVFDEDQRRYLKRRLPGDYRYVVEKSDDNDFLGEDSGLFFASKFPILDQRFQEFYAKQYFTSDALCDKGIFGACLDVNSVREGQVLFVFNCHLQSTLAFHKVRSKQLAQVCRFVGKALNNIVRRGRNPNSISALLTGDLNVVGDNTEEYLNMMSLLGYPRDLYREMNPLDGAAGNNGYTWNARDNRFLKDNDENDRDMQRLDYIFAYNCIPGADDNQWETTRLNKLKCPFCRLVIPRSSGTGVLPPGYDLSDHYGVEAGVTI